MEKKQFEVATLKVDFESLNLKCLSKCESSTKLVELRKYETRRGKKFLAIHTCLKCGRKNCCAINSKFVEGEKND